jgi:hypothetical protein
MAFLAIIGLCLANLFPKKEPDKNYFFSFCLILFILIYYTASIFSDVSATIRYQIIIFPLAFILAGIGIYNFIQLSLVRKYLTRPVIYSVLILFSAYSLWSIKPFYFSYASDLLPPEYVLNLKDMGDGSYEAAEYLNHLPDAQNLSIWTDKRGVCSFFNGFCDGAINLTKKEATFDYFVVSDGRETRTSKMTLSRFNRGDDQVRLDKLYTMEDKDLEWKLEIGGRPNNSVAIIKAEKIIEN